MAKLEGVKVIDMVGGEVTKIAYDGEEYAKVDGVGMPGDIGLRVSNDVSWARLGEYFEMERSGTWLYYTDNVGDTPAVKQSQWAFFRKTSAQPTLTDRVDELETRVSALEEGGKKADVFVKIDRKPRVGDYVVFTKSSDSDITVGKYYEITGFDSHGDPRFIDDAGEGNVQGYYEEVEFFEKVTDNPSQIITGDPQVGDKIRIVNAWMAFGDYKNGEIHTVVRLRDDVEKGAVDIDVEGSAYVNRREFEIISRPEKAEEPTLKVGDYAKVVRSIYEFNAGDFVKIVGRKGDGSVHHFDFKVDFVNVTGTNKISGQTSGYIDAENIIKATDEEVAEAKRKLAEEQKAKKWAEIGRKPNEFKKGDIVRVVDVLGTVHLKEGQLTEVVTGDGTDCPVVKVSNGGTRYAEVELITPVERRFDR